MGRCDIHQDRETSYLCLKYNSYLCPSCLKCKDPEIYCRYRTSCVIHYLTVNGEHIADEQDVPLRLQPKEEMSHE